jgi:WD40 repeat protein/uncharacterized caspase-like protein
VQSFIARLLAAASLAWLSVGSAAAVPTCDRSSSVAVPGARGLQVLTQLGHAQGPRAVAVSPDGCLVASGDSGGVALLWDTASGLKLRHLEGVGHVRSMDFSPDGVYLRITSLDEASAWNVRTGALLWRFGTKSWDGQGVDRFLAFGPRGTSAGTWLYAIRRTESVRSKVSILEAPTGRVVLSFELPEESSRDFAFSKDGRYALIGSGKALHLVEVRAEAQPRAIPLSGEPRIRGLALAPGADRAALVMSSAIVLVDLASGSRLREIPNAGAGMPRMSFSPQGSFLITDDGAPREGARLWNAASGQEFHSFRVPKESNNPFDTVEAYIFSYDEKRLVTIRNHAAQVWDVGTHTLAPPLEQPGFVVFAAGLSSDGRYLALGARDAVGLWNMETRARERRFELAAKGNFLEWSDAAISSDHQMLVTTTGDGLRFWSTRLANVTARIPNPTSPPGYRKVRLSPSGDRVVAVAMRSAEVRSVTDGRLLHAYSSDAEPGISQDGRLLVVRNADRLLVYEIASGREVFGVSVDSPFKNDPQRYPFTNLSIGRTPDGGKLFIGESGTGRLWNVADRRLLRTFSRERGENDELRLTRDGNFVVAVNFSVDAIWSTTTGHVINPLAHSVAQHLVLLGDQLFFEQRHLTAFGGDPKALGEFAGSASIVKWLPEGIGRPDAGGLHRNVSRASISANGRYLVTAPQYAEVRLYDLHAEEELARLVGFPDQTWAWITPRGVFDTEDVRALNALHVAFADDPYRPFPMVMAARDYFEPRLVQRLIACRDATTQSGRDVCAREFKALRPLETLNRARPDVKAIRVLPGSAPNTARVEVDVAGGSYAQGGKATATGAYDLRLFRGGRLVRQAPDPKVTTPEALSGDRQDEWRRDMRIVAAGARGTVVFDEVRLPRRSSAFDSTVSLRRGELVEFSAYAFSEDRIRSDVATASVSPAPGLASRTAHVIAIGVDRYGENSGGWNLQYAAHDARQMAGALRQYLGATYSVRMTLLVSDAEQQDATKSRIRGAIEDLAGRSTPDDLVFVFFAGHGYSGDGASFYLLPGGSDPGREKSPTLTRAALDRGISSEELAHWFRAIDAAEFVLIVDACQSAASIAAGDFKPGPFGAAGLGQLAFDKRMRVLAASQSDQAAREIGGSIGHGLLTYALLRDALEQKRAAAPDGSIRLRNWLQYAVNRVPGLVEEVRADFAKRGFKVDGEDATAVIARSVQVPTFFDFAGTEGPQIEHGVRRSGQP